MISKQDLHDAAKRLSERAESALADVDLTERVATKEEAELGTAAQCSGLDVVSTDVKDVSTEICGQTPFAATMSFGILMGLEVARAEAEKGDG